MEMLLLTAIPAIVAIGMVHWFFFKILRIAKDKNLVDNPDARKLQKTPVPVLGGIAVFLGLVAGTLTGEAILTVLHIDDTMPVLPVMLAMVMMMYIGAMDDVLGLTAVSRLVIETVAIAGMIFASDWCIDTLHGLFGISTIPWWFAVPLTIFAGVGIINAVNMIDGVNGLSSGLCIMCCVFFGMAFVDIGDEGNAILAFSMAGALFPFLMHNVFGQTSKMFIGDAGTMVMGMLMVWFCISLLDCHNEKLYMLSAPNMNMVCFTLAVLSVPVADTLRVMTMRVRHGKSPLKPDKTHLHHAFILVGISHSVTALTEISLGIMVVVLWRVAVMLGANANVQLVVVIASSALLVWGTYALLRINARKHTAFLHYLTRIGLKTQIRRYSWCMALERWLDAPEEKMIKEMGLERSAEHLSHRYGLGTVLSLEDNRERVVKYMSGKAEVYIIDIMRNSGADPGSVLEALAAEEHYGNVMVTKTDENGQPEIVALKVMHGA